MKPSYRPTPAACTPHKMRWRWPPGLARKRLMYSWSTVSMASPLAVPPSSCTPGTTLSHTGARHGEWLRLTVRRCHVAWVSALQDCWVNH